MLLSLAELDTSRDYVVGWGTLALLNAGLAQGKGRSGLNWFLISIFLGPIATFLLVVLEPLPREPSDRDPGATDERAGSPIAGRDRLGSSAMRSRRSLVLLALLAAACGRSEEAEVQDLAEGFRPRLQPRDPWVETPSGTELVLEPGPDGATVGIEARLDDEDWSRGPFPSTWSTERPLGRAADSETPPLQQELRGEERAFTPVVGDPSVAAVPEPGTFRAAGSLIVAKVEEGAPAPEDALFREVFSLGAEAEGAWTTELGRYRAPAIPVLPDLSTELALDLPPDAVLVCATATQGPEEEDGPSEVRFRVRWNDAILLDTTQPVRLRASAVPRRVALPPGGGKGTLTLEVDGTAALTAFLAPRVAPAEPEPSSRPDLVLFVADTFRADNLEAYGGDPRIAPNLNAFAERSAAFLGTRSPSSWTLPSLSSMFSGLYPHEIGVTSRTTALPEEVTTLAEAFRDAGYRTGAVTEAVFFSRTFGLDAGFEWFDEARDAGEPIQARVRDFLAMDDGRPILLVVHTYRAHSPYSAGDAVRARFAGDLPLEQDYADLHLPWPAGELHDPTPEQRDELLRAEALYRAGSAELDLEFARVLEVLAEHGRADAWTLFTADHGEAFGEHGLLQHGNGVFEELIRVPLLLRGPGVDPGFLEGEASLVDVPRTLAAIADVEADERWGGRDLLATSPRPVYAFEASFQGGASTVAVVDGHRKLVLAQDPETGELELLHAFELDADAGETRDARDRPWVPELLRRERPRLEALLVSRFEAGPVELGEGAVEGLRALGYLED